MSESPLSRGRGVSSIGLPWERNCEELWERFCLAFRTDFRENPSTLSTDGGVVAAEDIALEKRQRSMRQVINTRLAHPTQKHLSQYFWKKKKNLINDPKLHISVFGTCKEYILWLNSPWYMGHYNNPQLFSCKILNNFSFQNEYPPRITWSQTFKNTSLKWPLQAHFASTIEALC